MATVLYRPDPVLLEALLSPLDRGGRRIYVFVNGPIAPSAQERLRKLANAVVISSDTNLGLGAALNALMERAVGDGYQHVLLMDQDSTPTPALPEALLARFLAQDRPDRPLAVMAPWLQPPAEDDYLPIRYAWRERHTGAVHFAPTSGSLLSTAAWRTVGPFRADYFIGGIDVEWGFRAWSRGYASLVATDISLVHRWGLPQGHAGKRKPAQILRHSDERNFYYIRNAVACLRLPHIPIGWRARYACNLAAQIAVLLHRRGYGRTCRRLVAAAVSAGLKGQLGRAAMDFSESTSAS